MNRILRLRDGSALNTFGLVAIALLVATIVFAALVIMPVYSMYKSPPKLGTGSRATAQAVDKFHDVMNHSVDMVDGRSWFYEPKPPEPEVPAIKVAKKYAGPQLTHIINGTAWFADGQKVSPSEPKSKTLELVKSNAPWSVTVKWEGGEFEVDLFKRVDLLSLKDGASFTSSYPAATVSFGTRPPDASAETNLNGRPASDRGDRPPEARFGPGVSQSPPPMPPGNDPVPAAGAPLPPQTAPAPTPTPGTSPAPPQTEPAQPPQPAPGTSPPAAPPTGERHLALPAHAPQHPAPSDPTPAP